MASDTITFRVDYAPQVGHWIILLSPLDLVDHLDLPVQAAASYHGEEDQEAPDGAAEEEQEEPEPDDGHADQRGGGHGGDLPAQAASWWSTCQDRGRQGEEVGGESTGGVFILITIVMACNVRWRDNSLRLILDTETKTEDINQPCKM